MISLIQSILLFAAGGYASIALRSGLVANTGVAVLAAFWLITLFYRRRTDDAVRQPDPPTQDQLTRAAEHGGLRSILDHAPVPLLTVSPAGLLRAENRAARLLFQSDDIILTPPPALMDAIVQARPGERSVVRFAPAPGKPDRSHALSVANSIGPAGPQLLAALADIQAELQAIEAATLRELLQTLSHEIMNSLTPVSSLAESAHALLSDGTPGSTAAAVDALETIVRRARGLDRFVHGYRLLARVPPPILRASSVTSLLSDAASLFRTRWPPAQVHLDIAIPTPDIILPMDADLVIQALMNLMSNAAEAALSAPVPRISISATTQGTRLQLAVADTGPGVDAAEADAIFRPFFTLKPDGTGIGLSLARQIAQSHGGDLTLDRPIEGQGARFVMLI